MSVLRSARVEIRHGQFQRTMALITAFAAIVSGWEAYAQHLRGAFAHWLMWTPVGLTPPTVVAALGAIASERVGRRVLPVLAVISLVDGVVGFVFHIRGIGRMPGGWALGRYNVVMGPPVFAPLLTCMVGVVGVIAGLLRPETRRPRRWDFAPRRSVADRVAHGRFQRSLALVTAIFATLAGGEAYFEHLRGSFNQRWMWTPVWVTPPMVAAGVGAAFSQRVAEHVLPLAAAVTFVDGMLGFVLHLQGIQRMPGGLRNLQFNFTMGPPLFAPLLFSSVGLLGFIAALVRRARA
ncbi:MAG: hypothetical protein JOY61_11860 [Chloroflexi bacterium]|nr:hypothetical protein [Chloroflexota bacterium]